jgi:hypothetical protein
VTAGGLLAPLFIAMDLFALRVAAADKADRRHIRADRRLRCICCRSDSARKFTQGRRAFFSPSAMRAWTLMAICLLAIPVGVWLGWRLHGKLDQRQLYRSATDYLS